MKLTPVIALLVMWPVASFTAEPAEPIPDTATVAGIMKTIIAPAADVLWAASADTMTDEGEYAVALDAGAWRTIDQSRAELAAASEALLLPGRPVDAPGAMAEFPDQELNPGEIAALIEKQPALWAGMVGAMSASVAQAQQAIAGQDVDALTDAGGAMYETCDACHKQFWYPNRKY